MAEQLAETNRLLAEILAELRCRPVRKPQRVRSVPVRDRAREWLVRKLREAGPEGVEWKRIVVEATFEGAHYSEATLRRVRSEIAHARYAGRTCYWILREGSE